MARNYTGPDNLPTPNVIVNCLDAETGNPIPPHIQHQKYQNRGEVEIVTGGPVVRYNIWLFPKQTNTGGSSNA